MIGSIDKIRKDPCQSRINQVFQEGYDAYPKGRNQFARSLDPELYDAWEAGYAEADDDYPIRATGR